MTDAVQARFCVDCKHYYRGASGATPPFCVRRIGGEVPRDLVSGQLCRNVLISVIVTGQHFPFCASERAGDSKEQCGPIGQFFEPNPHGRMA